MEIIAGKTYRFAQRGATVNRFIATVLSINGDEAEIKVVAHNEVSWDVYRKSGNVTTIDISKHLIGEM